MKLLFALAFAVGLAAATPSYQNFLSDEYIEHINKVATTWKAGRNFAKDTPLSYIKRLMGTKIIEKQDVLPVRDLEIGDLPSTFDARAEWPDCPSLSEIRDQSDCGSCWAIAAAETMTDRQCIQKGEQFHYSTQDITSCCLSCGDGCDGGYPIEAMQYWVETGVVSGGQYGTNEGCVPYSLQPCDHHVNGTLVNCDDLNLTTPPCQTTCESSYNVSYADDKHFASEAYSIGANENAIMTEVYNNGPVEAAFTVWSDFPSYTSGVYQRTMPAYPLGGHAVKILGWGVEDGEKYWLVANSWNTEWGDKGYFKILRGVDECGIERQCVAGTPA